MATLLTINEAERVFETYFINGLKYNGTLTQITSSRNPNNVGYQRMGMQLQFLAALYPRTTDTNRKGRIASEISLILSILNQNGNFKHDNITYSNALDDPGPAMTLLGLALIKKGPTYNALTTRDRRIVDVGGESLFSRLGTNLYQFCIKTVNADTSPYKYKGVYNVPNFSLNTPSLIAGALGVYSDLVNHSLNHRSAIVTLANTVVGRYGYTKTGRTFIPIGGRNNVRKPFGSSGYNSYTGMGLALAAHGHTGTGSLSTPSNGGGYLTQAKQISGYYTSVLNSGNKAYHLHEPFDFDGTMSTELSIDQAKEIMISENIGSSPSSVTSTSPISNATMLLNHKSPTVYLYNLAWTADTTFLTALDKRVVATGEAKNLNSVSAMRACMNALSPASANAAAANRILSGFAACLEREITYITDGK